MFHVIGYKQNIVKYDVTDQMICSYETTFLQYVRDNTDQDLATVHHGLGSIAIVNSKFSKLKLIRQALPRDKKQNWSDIVSNKGIKI